MKDVREEGKWKGMKGKKRKR